MNDQTSERPSGARAGFLGGLLAFLSFVALSVIGVGHARTIEGAANAQFWIVVALVAAALAFVTAALARTTAGSTVGEAARKAAVALAAVWLLVFLWETVAVGTGAFSGPFELGWAAWKG
ncbi:MAG: hypothetical protein DI565_10990 [Ancylobacter novellus]|uniref:Uncharacterized protein n=1 Tax=Ancylobacter novellus TaxID=921 RepID=A0A2W5MN90_ANCNO|nr:MAG: hypothetical protein DI565_10990 [Ancylobacter novellus]